MVKKKKSVEHLNKKPLASLLDKWYLENFHKYNKNLEDEIQKTQK